MGTARDVIASRAYRLLHPAGPATSVSVRIRRPFLAQESEYRCEYEVDGLTTEISTYAAGVDEMQALWLGLVGAGKHLRDSDEGKAGHIEFLDGPDLFLPPHETVPDPEWHTFEDNGRELHFRRYPAWHQDAKGAWRRHWALEVASRPGGFSIGTTHPEDTDVRVEHARALVRLAEESGHPIKV